MVYRSSLSPLLSVSAAVLLLSGGCGGVAAVSGPRADEQPVSQVLLDAFFTNGRSQGGYTYNSYAQLGPRIRSFNPDRDKQLVFVAVFHPRHSVAVRGVLFRPSGDQHGTLNGTLDARPGGTWQSKSWWWDISRLKAYQGEWVLHLWVNGEPMGRYYITLQGEPLR